MLPYMELSYKETLWLHEISRENVLFKSDFFHIILFFVDAFPQKLA